MMREIKFRAWDAIRERYAPIDDLDITMEGKWTTYLCHDYGGHKGPEIILEQYTGLHDKNGREGYFGDIIKTKIGQWDYLRSIYALANGCPAVDLPAIDSNTDRPTLLFDLSKDEIVGNIHENPELLK
jgi:hypothetical protein